MKENTLSPAPIYTEEQYNLMDKIANITYVNIYSTFKNNNCISLNKDFDFSNTEHLYLLHICYIVSRINGWPIKINGHRIKILFWNLKNIKRFNSIKQIPKKNREAAVSVEYLLQPTRALLTDEVNYTNIYNEYYNIKKGKK